MHATKTVQTTAECPYCKAAMSKLADADGVLAACVSCGGMWVDNTAARWVLQNLLSPEARAYVKTFATHEAAPHQSAYRAKEQITKACPVCRNDLVATKMNDPIMVVDICPQHGTFFDKSELALLVSTVEIRALQSEADRVADAATASWNNHIDPMGHNVNAGDALTSLFLGVPYRGR